MGLLGTVSHTLTGWARRLLRDNRTMVRGYFEHIYRNQDPYRTITDPEGERKRDDIIAAIAGRRF